MRKDLSWTKRALATIVAIGGLVAACASASAWQINVNGTLPNASDGAEAVVVDASGNVISAGFTQNTSSGFDFTVVKFRGSTGAEIWRRVIDGSGTGGLSGDFDSAKAVAVDAFGNVVAAGFTANGGASDFTVVKLAGGTGVELWRQTINGDGNSADQAVGILVDGSGDVVAAGSIVQNTGNLGGFTVVKFAGSTGVELWRQTINGTAANSADTALAVTVDHAGDVLAAGITQNTLGANSFTVVKFAGSTGAPLWRKVVKGLKALKGVANSDDEALAIAVDAAGDVVAGGMTQNDLSGHDFTVIKLAGATGAELWSQVIRGTTSGEDQVRAVAVDRNGDVLAAGFTENATTKDDFTVVKLAGASGTPLWQRVIHGTAAPSGSAFEHAAAVVVDTAGNVVAAGTTQNTGTFFDFTVVKLNGTDGSSYCGSLLCIPKLGQ